MNRRLSGSAIFLAFGTDGMQAPILTALRDLHGELSSNGVSYAIVGGVGVVQAGGARSTGDIDVLCDRAGWERFREHARTFAVEIDSATHRATSIPVDALFSDDDWDLPFKLPNPLSHRVWDDSFGAYFLNTEKLLELKAAVYISKNSEYGPATAAKDLGDVYAILRARPALRTATALFRLHPSVRPVVRKVVMEVEQNRT